MADFERLCGSAAERGRKIVTSLMDQLGKRYNDRALPDFYIEKAATLLGVSASQIRALERNKKIPEPRKESAGSLQRRVYNYNEINQLRELLNLKPESGRTVRAVFANLKGGVAKTTSALHLIHYAAREGYKVLAVDLDPQATLSANFGIISDLDLLEDAHMGVPLTDGPEHMAGICRETHWDNIKIAPASLALQRVDWVLPAEDAEQRQRLGSPVLRLSAALNKVEQDYDLVVIDTPPALGALSINSIAAADLIIVPIEPHLYSLASSVQFFQILAEVGARYRDAIRVQNIHMLMTKVDDNPETAAIIRLLNSAYGAYIMTNRMPLTRELQRAGTDQVSLYEIDRPRGAPETYQRAVQAMEVVNQEIMQNIVRFWDADSSSGGGISTTYLEFGA